MHGEVDAYTGATVTPNNAMRMLQGLFEYHNERYM
jgi:Na+-translocating ferredoxin:NAD+ oxidoreductase RnfG subunit